MWYKCTGAIGRRVHVCQGNSFGKKTQILNKFHALAFLHHRSTTSYLWHSPEKNGKVSGTRNVKEVVLTLGRTNLDFVQMWVPPISGSASAWGTVFSQVFSHLSPRTCLRLRSAWGKVLSDQVVPQSEEWISPCSLFHKLQWPYIQSTQWPGLSNLGAVNCMSQWKTSTASPAIRGGIVLLRSTLLWPHLEYRAVLGNAI